MNMTPSFEVTSDRMAGWVTPAAFLSLLTFGTVCLYNMPQNFILPQGVFIMVISFTFLVVDIGIKNEKRG
jgi:hypothetical protein